MTGPATERDLVLYELLEARGHGVPVDEAHVARALDPLALREFTDPPTMERAVSALLRSAGAFVLDAYNVWEVIQSGPPPQMDVLPPLPFKRVWIEAQLDGKPTSYTAFEPRVDSMPIFIRGVGIIENEPRQDWTVILPIAGPDVAPNTHSGYWNKLGIRATGAAVEQETLSLRGDVISGSVWSGLTIPIGFRMTPKGLTGLPSEYAMELAHHDSGWQDIVFTAMRQIVVNATHLISARNVPHREVAIGRGQRKRYARAGVSRLPTAPKIYYVDLNAAGEIKHTGSGREYTHRWLVMGHWMHFDGTPNRTGKERCTCWRHRDKPISATWRSAYVKGPAGAGWLGKPMHTDIERKDAA